MTYEWDPAKARANAVKHRVSFEEAASVPRPLCARSGIRITAKITIGRSGQQRVLFVAHAPREGRIRIVGARKATRKEKKQYEEATQ